LFLCADQTKPKCCQKSAGLEAWDYLKKRLKTLDLETGDRRVYRTKANCLRGCDYQLPGPILLVYPGGYWYRSATPEVIERILQEHIVGGMPVAEYLVSQTPFTEIVDGSGVALEKASNIKTE
jgi:(2Fe-2S) ferredoxin